MTLLKPFSDKPIVWTLILAAVCCVLALCIGVTTPTDVTHTVRALAQVTPVDTAWRATLPDDPDVATQMYVSRLPEAARRRSDAYFEGGYWLLLWNEVAILVVSALLLFSGFSARLRDVSESLVTVPSLQCTMFVVCYFLLIGSYLSPLSVYQGFFREHAYGLANQTFFPWLIEAIVDYGITLVAGSVFVVMVYAIARRSPAHWWLLSAGIGVLFLAFDLLLQPVYIDPLFNDYQPLADGPTKTAVISLARANGVPTNNVSQFNESKQSDRISANVSGLLGTVAVRLNDNLLQRTSLGEIKAVTAHEIGHYVLHHVYKGFFVMSALLLAGLALLKAVLNWILSQWGMRWGIRSIADPAGLPLAIAIVSTYFFLIVPILNSTSRIDEAEADIFGLNAAAEPDAFAEAMLKLTEYRKVNPGWLEEVLFFDHPSPAKRIQTAMRWKAEHRPK